MSVNRKDLALLQFAIATCAMAFLLVGYTVRAQNPKPKLLLDWNSVYVTENGLLSIKPWANGFPKQIYLGKELDAKVEVWVESPDGGKQQVFITLGDLRSLIYTRARARVYGRGSQE